MNENYAAAIVKIESLSPLPGLDNLLSTKLLGYDVLVSKNTLVGEIGVLLPAEAQLSDWYARDNNLYRHESLNADGTVRGYLEDNRRVKAIRLRGYPSNGIFMPLSSLGAGPYPKLGTSFSEFKGREVCRKYEIQNSRPGVHNAPKAKLAHELARVFPRHTDTLQWFRNQHQVQPNDILEVTQKLHGTSIRIGKVRVPLPWYKRLWQKLGGRVRTHAPVVGTRNTIKDLSHAEDLWVKAGKALAESLPPDTIVYGELIGWNGNKPIQKGYTYNVPKGECRLYVYNVVGPGGELPELTYVPWLETVAAKHFDWGRYENKRFGPVPLSDPKSVDEGVCLRVVGTNRIYKVKSSQFLEYESKQLDKGEIDVESDA